MNYKMSYSLSYTQSAVKTPKAEPAGFIIVGQNMAEFPKNRQI